MAEDAAPPRARSPFDRTPTLSPVPSYREWVALYTVHTWKAAESRLLDDTAALVHHVGKAAEAAGALRTLSFTSSEEVAWDVARDHWATFQIRLADAARRAARKGEADATT